MKTNQDEESSIEGEGDNKNDLSEKQYLLSKTQTSVQHIKSSSTCCPNGGKLKSLVTFIALWCAYLVISAAYSIISPFYPQEAQDYGVGSLTVGIIVGASPLAVVVLSPIFGYFIPQLGLKFLLISGCVLVGGCFVLLGFLIEMPSKFQFILFSVLLRFGEGVGSAAYFTASFTIASILYPESTGTVMGILEVGSGIGFVSGPPLGGLLYNVGGFRLPFLVTGGLTLLFIPVFLLTVPNTRGKKIVLPPKTLFKLFQDVPFLILSCDNIAIVAGLGFFTPTFAPFLKQQFGLSEFHIGLVYLCGPVMYILSSFAAGKLSDVIGPRYLIVSGMFVVGIAYFFVGPAYFISSESHIWLTCVAFGILGTGLGFGIVPIFPDMLKIARKIDKDTDFEIMNGIISGLTSSTLCLGETIGPIMGGTLTQVLSFQLSAVVFGEVLIANAFLLFGITIIDRLFTQARTNVNSNTSVNQ